MRNKTDAINSFLFTHEIDIFILVESWLQTNDDFYIKQCLANLESYSFFTLNRYYSNGGGIVILFRTDFNVSVCSSICNEQIELLTVKCEARAVNFHLTDVYRPPAACFKTFFNIFNEETEDYFSACEKYVALGEFNIHMNKNMDSKTHVQ